MKAPAQPERFVVLGGGVSAEREVSLASSKAVYEVLKTSHRAEWIDVSEAALPAGLNPATDVIFPVLHGTWGEDGGIQALLESAGCAYVGCDAASSARCIDKVMTKQLVGAAGVPVSAHLPFAHDAVPTWQTACEAMGQEAIVLKPAAEGSSVGLFFIETEMDWLGRTRDLRDGVWMIEPRLSGHDVTVGMLAGEALGVVGIFPNDGAAYDYAHKYTAGATRYEVPAALPDDLTAALRDAATRAFSAVGCRDFARIDFYRDGDRFTFLEINTIPGLTATSLLPKSASICGIDFAQLVERMLAPAVARFQCREAYQHG